MSTETMIAQEEHKLYWMPIYLDQMISGTDHMDAAELGGYLRLLIEQFQKEHITSDVKKLKKLSRLPQHKLETVLEKFVKGNDGNLRNNKCTQVRTEQYGKRREAVLKAQKAANARHSKKTTQHQPTELTMQPITDSAMQTSNTQNKALQQLRLKTINNDQWVESQSALYRMASNKIILFCHKWINTAERNKPDTKYDTATMMHLLEQDLKEVNGGM